MSRIYTEEQVRKAISLGYDWCHQKHIPDDFMIDNFINSLIPIELPTDEEIIKQSKYIAHNYFEMHHANHYQGLEEGSLRMASWMRDKIKGEQDNE